MEQSQLYATANGGKLRSIAIVSGKGGSGKTLIAAAFGRALATSGRGPTVLVDADTGTSGLSLFLGISSVQTTAFGLADLQALFSESSTARQPTVSDEPPLVLRAALSRALQPVESDARLRLLATGSRRRLDSLNSEALPPIFFPSLLYSLEQVDDPPSWVVVDCRGGIDAESLAICRKVDDILVVAEADITSMKASEHVVDVLSANDCSDKLRGFVLNKLIDSPQYVARTGTSIFQCAYLGAIPFDISATRAFLVGVMPKADSAFCLHVMNAMERAYPGPFVRHGRQWSDQEFRDVGLSSPDVVYGGTACSIVIVFVGLALAYNFRHNFAFLRYEMHNVYVTALIGFAALSSLDSFRRGVGYLVGMYVNAFSRRITRTTKL